MSEYISQLSSVQREAAVNYKGAALVIAGAGSGKTRVLTCRIAYMISQGIAPSKILALTFTNKAAREMRERIATVIDSQAARQLWMGTFHSVFARILRQEAEHIGFPSSFTIYETADSRNLVKTIVKEMNLNEDKYKPKEIFSRISLMKNSLTTPSTYANQPQMIGDDIKAGRGEFAAIYRNYMKRCKTNGAMDFDDLLLYTNILFRDKPEVLVKYQELFEYILVDEYQDTNFSQYLIIKKLSEMRKNICVVGDDAQSIYSFRGAKIENILRFQKDYPEAKVHKLEENYRSTQTIVGAANSIIARNSNQLKKNVFSKKEIGDPIMLFRSEGDRDEAVAICRDIESANRSEATNFSDMAILYRTNSQSKAFEDQLRMRNIPYKIYGGMSFYQRAEIKNIIAYIRTIVNPHDDEAVKRIINFPARGIGATTITKVEDYARANEVSFWSAISKCTPAELSVNSGTAKKISDFVALILELKAKKDDVDIYELTFELVGRSGILALYRDNPAPEAQSSYQNVEELINSLKSQVEATAKEEDIKLMADSWIQDVTLLTDMDQQEEGVENRQEVALMTIHSAKGLEFGTVYIVGVEEGIFPSSRSVESQNDIEEERRLFYVAVTRAVKRLVVSFALSRYKWGSVTPSSPSRFLKEIDKKYIDEPDLLNLGYSSDESEKDSSEKNSSEKNEARSMYGEIRDNRKGGLSSLPPKSRESKPEPVVMPKGNFTAIKKSIGSSNVSDAPIDYKIEVGDRVEHDRFGFGEVISKEQIQNDLKVTVNFDLHATKTLLMKFAKLRKIES